MKCKVNKNTKGILSIFLSLILILSTALLCMSVSAEENTGLTISGDTAGIIYNDEDHSYTLTSGEYTAEGSADGEYIIINGDVVLNLNDTDIICNSENDDYHAAISIENGSLELIISGSNEVQGDTGCAGIYVSSDSKLIISGDGVLTAEGGTGAGTVSVNSYGSGAGIGGNGIFTEAKTGNIISDPSFGEIIINSGTINATGGTSSSSNLVGSGAGIGSGGASEVGGALDVNGIVTINGGTIHAVGGDNSSANLTGGGAGIGCGGVEGNNYGNTNSVKIKINGGDITAEGRADGAGIGGGANAGSGTISICDGSISAYGGYENDNGEEYSFYGGAGIGGGDNGLINSIVISGGSIYAEGAGAAAGIGGGNDAETLQDESDRYTIEINGLADVTAVGGTAYNSRGEGPFGGAGIGAGQSYYYDSDCGNIIIADSTTVRAYAGAGAQSIGVGSNYEGDSECSSLKITKADDNTYAEISDIWGINLDADFTAFWGLQGNNEIDYDEYSSDGELAVWYTNTDDEYPAPDTVVSAYDASSLDEFTWSYSENDGKKTISLYYDDYEISTASTMYDLGNWVTFVNVEPEITFDWSGDYPEEISLPDAITTEIGTSGIVIENPEDTEDYHFNGWYTDKECTKPYSSDMTIYENMTLYGSWSKLYSISFDFVSGTDGLELPEEIYEYLPSSDNKYVADTLVTLPDISYSYHDDLAYGTWVFEGWSQSVFTVGEDNTTVVGTWIFIADDVYHTVYEFESETEGAELPDEVLALLPSDESEYHSGDTIIAEELLSNTYYDSILDGTWTFEGWSQNEQTVSDTDILFSGKWTFSYNYYSNSYVFVSGAEGMELPDEINEYLPTDSGSYKTGESIVPAAIDNLSYYDSINHGTWTFESWDSEEKLVDHSNIVFTGTWVFKADTYKVTYSFAADDEENLPAEILSMIPIDNNEYNYGDIISVTPPENTTVAVYDENGSIEGYWIFEGYNVDTIIAGSDDNDNLTILGIWTYTEIEDTEGSSNDAFEEDTDTTVPEDTEKPTEEATEETSNNETDKSKDAPEEVEKNDEEENTVEESEDTTVANGTDSEETTDDAEDNMSAKEETTLVSEETLTEEETTLAEEETSIEEDESAITETDSSQEETETEANSSSISPATGVKAAGSVVAVLAITLMTAYIVKKKKETEQ